MPAKGDFFVIEDTGIMYYLNDPTSLNRQIIEKIERLAGELIRFRCPELKCSVTSRADKILNAVAVIVTFITVALIFYLVLRGF